MVVDPRAAPALAYVICSAGSPRGEPQRARAAFFLNPRDSPAISPSEPHDVIKDQAVQIYKLLCIVSNSARLSVHSHRIPIKTLGSSPGPGQIALFPSGYRLAVDHISKSKYKTWLDLLKPRLGCHYFRKPSSNAALVALNRRPRRLSASTLLYQTRHSPCFA